MSSTCTGLADTLVRTWFRSGVEKKEGEVASSIVSRRKERRSDKCSSVTSSLSFACLWSHVRYSVSLSARFTKDKETGSRTQRVLWLHRRTGIFRLARPPVVTWAASNTDCVLLRNSERELQTNMNKFPWLVRIDQYNLTCTRVTGRWLIIKPARKPSKRKKSLRI